MHDAKKDLEGKSELFLDRVTSQANDAQGWHYSAHNTWVYYAPLCL